jgi:hypothetical protein
MSNPNSEYTPVNECFTCLEDYLLFIDFGLSEVSAGHLASMRHVLEARGGEKYFPKFAREFLTGQNNYGQNSRHS